MSRKKKYLGSIFAAFLLAATALSPAMGAPVVIDNITSTDNSISVNVVGTAVSVINSGDYTLQGNDNQVTASGVNGLGVSVNSGGKFQLNGSMDVKTSSTSWPVNGHGIGAGDGEVVLASDSHAKITTSGVSSYGIYAHNGGRVTADGNLDITTALFGAHGIHLDNAALAFGENSNTSITVNGSNAYGLVADYSTFTSDGKLSVTTTLGGGWGIHAFYTRSSDVTFGEDSVTELNVAGNGASGLYAVEGAKVAANGSLHVDSGAGQWGAAVTADAAAITMGAASQTTITTAGDGTHGYLAQNGGVVTLQEGSRSTINTTGAAAFGMRAMGGTILSAGSVDITGTTNGSHGIASEQGGRVVLTNTSQTAIETDGYRSHGFYVSGGTVSSDGVITIKTQGTQSDGFFVENGKIAHNGGLFITTNGETSRGIYADASIDAAEISVSGVASIQTTGTDAHAIHSINSGDIRLDGLIVASADGVGATGIYALNGGTVSSTQDSVLYVTALQDDSHGISAAAAGQVMLEGKSYILANGAAARGVTVDGAGSSVTVMDGDIYTYGAASYGVHASNGGSADVAGSVTTDGAGSVGLFSDNGHVTMTGDSLNVADGWYLQTENNGAIRVSDLPVGNGTNLQLLKTSSSGNVTAESGDLTGNIEHDGTTVGNLSLNLIDSSLTGMANAAGYGAIDLALNGSRWTVTGDSRTNGALNAGSGGIVDYTNAAPGTTVTANSLSGNADLLMKTNIQAQQGDLLVVEGTTGGSHNITVSELGDAATPTTGHERVTLVKTADTGGDFALTNGMVEVGAWQYSLGNFANGAGGQDWQLYANSPSNPASTATSTFIASYLLVYVETDTLMQRLGDLRNETMQGREGAWFRAFGGKFESDARGFSRGFDMDQWGVQAGYDHRLENSWFKNGATYVGAFVGLGNGDIDYDDGLYSTGEIDNRTLGMYATYVADNGWYFDAVAKYVWSENKFTAKDGSGGIVDGGDVNTGGVGLSFETGKRLWFGDAGKNGGKWYAEPQAQLSWQHMGSGTYNTSSGLRIGVDDYDSLIGRVGFLVGFESARTNLYAKGFYLKEFGGDLNIHANGVGIYKESLDDDWFVYGIGVAHRVNDRNALYLDVERSIGGDFEQKWRINGGWRISF